MSDAQLDALVGTDKHVTDAQTDAAIDFIDRSKDEPFFAFVSEFAPHFPVNDAQARSDLLAKYRAKAPGSAPAKPSYAALTEAVDQSVARIVDYLETTPGPAQRRQAARRQHARHLHLRQRRRGGPDRGGRLERPAP